MRFNEVLPQAKSGRRRAVERRRSRISAVMLSERSEDRDFAKQNRKSLPASRKILFD